MLFPQLFEQSVARTPEREAVVDLRTDETTTYRELREQAHTVGNELLRRDVERGDRVAICMANRPEHVVTFMGTQLIGAVATPFNFRLPAERVRYHLHDSDPALFLFDELSRESVERTNRLPDINTVYVGDDPPAFAEPFEALLDGSTERPTVSVGYDDPSVVLYSSGTTGEPKGIPLTHEATSARLLTNSLGQRYYLGETMPGVMPLYHTVGLHGILCCLLGTSGTYLCAPQFDPERFVRAIEKWSVTAIHEAPTIFTKLLGTEAIEEVDMSSVRAVGYSGAPMSQSVFEDTLAAFDPDHIANLYGTTETYGTLAYLDLHEIRDPTVTGPANVFFETRIVASDTTDPTDEVPTGTGGELIVNTDSPVSFTSYWNKPDRTAEAVHDGWFFTGDVARQTDNGYVVITGRVDDMIITGGENVHPAEVEDVLLSHPAVADAGVIGIADEEWGEIVKAFVVSDGTPDELEQWCLESDHLADFKRPRQYEFVETLPRNPSGKVMRYILREQED